MKVGKGAVEVKSYNFALRIINLYKFVAFKRKEFILSKQILRSGTAIGALVKGHRFKIGGKILSLYFYFEYFALKT